MVSPEMTKETAVVGISPVESTGHDDRSINDGRTGGTEDPLHSETDDTDEEIGRAIDELENKETSWFAYLKTKDFYIVLLLGYVIYPMRPSAHHTHDIY
jgi:hypothetical protein